MRCTVLTPLLHDGTRYDVGDEIDLADAQALLARGIVSKKSDTPPKNKKRGKAKPDADADIEEAIDPAGMQADG
ncbi:MAG: hypothetical protein AAF442_05405 [Pseudomonadota bacterium]